MAPRTMVPLIVMLAGPVILGCATTPNNPSFDVSASDARRALREMRESPRTLERPVVVIDGLGFSIGSWVLANEVRRATGDDRVISVDYDFTQPFDDCRRRVVRAVERHFPSDDPQSTREVDVIGISLGGILARYAACPPPQALGKRLKINRLFTIGSPHRGAEMAALPALLGQLQLDLRERSPFLRAMARRDKLESHYQIIPYVRLGDQIVGDNNASPPGQTPLWLPNLLLEGAHLMAFADPRIIADIARRLRGETPFATYPPQPLPS
jgi:pimeloyl-ACP methyl ester carboxylesterase